MRYLALLLILPCILQAQEVKTKDIISSGDTLLVTINGEPQISGQFLVSGDGDIAHALLGKIEVAKKSSTELSQHIINLLQDGYILKPAVSVSIIDQKPYQIRIIGEVTKPGDIVYPRDKTMDLGLSLIHI